MLKGSCSPLTSLRGVRRWWFTTLVLFYCLIVQLAGICSYLLPLRKTCSGSFCIHERAWGGSAGVFGVGACCLRCPGLNRPPQNMRYELMSCAVLCWGTTLISERVCVCTLISSVWVCVCAQANITASNISVQSQRVTQVLRSSGFSSWTGITDTSFVYSYTMRLTRTTLS